MDPQRGSQSRSIQVNYQGFLILRNCERGFKLLTLGQFVVQKHTTNTQGEVLLHCLLITIVLMLSGFSGGSDSTESACNARDPGSILASGRSPGEGHGNPLQHSCLENPMDTGAWRATVHLFSRSQM